MSTQDDLVQPAEDKWVVLLDRPGTIPEAQIPAVGRLLAQVCSIPFADGTRTAHRCQGILALDLGEAQAHQVASGLQDLGVPGSPRLESSLRALPRAVESRRVRMDEERFAPALGVEKDLGEWGWNDVAAICAGEIETVTTAVKVTQRGQSTTEAIARAALLTACTGIPLAPGPRPGTTERKEVVTAQLLLDIVTVRPEMHLRIHGQRFDYSLLGEQKELSHVPNDAALVRLLLSFARHAASNAPPEVAAAAQSPPWEKFSDQATFDDRVRWLWQIWTPA